jgi:hypothetical protein
MDQDETKVNRNLIDAAIRVQVKHIVFASTISNVMRHPIEECLLTGRPPMILKNVSSLSTLVPFAAIFFVWPVSMKISCQLLATVLTANQK